MWKRGPRSQKKKPKTGTGKAKTRVKNAKQACSKMQKPKRGFLQLQARTARAVLKRPSAKNYTPAHQKPTAARFKRETRIVASHKETSLEDLLHMSDTALIPHLLRSGHLVCHKKCPFCDAALPKGRKSKRNYTQRCPRKNCHRHLQLWSGHPIFHTLRATDGFFGGVCRVLQEFLRQRRDKQRRETKKTSNPRFKSWVLVKEI